MPDSAANNRPLAGLRVIDIATYIAQRERLPVSDQQQPVQTLQLP